MPANILNFDAFAIAVGKREERIKSEEGGKVVKSEVEKEGIIKSGDGKTVAVEGEEEEKEAPTSPPPNEFWGIPQPPSPPHS